MLYKFTTFLSLFVLFAFVVACAETDVDLADGDLSGDEDAASDGDEAADGDVSSDGDAAPDGDVSPDGDNAADGDDDPDTDRDGDEEREEEIDPSRLPFIARGVCETDLLGNTTFEPDPGEVSTQIHVNARFDGGAVWVAYSRPDNQGNGTFDVYALRLNCDGTRAVEPSAVNTTDANDLDPALAVSGGRVFFAWQSDDAQGLRNLNIYTRLFQTDGTPLQDTDRRFTAVLAGEPRDVNAWMPALAALPDGGFALAGSFGLDVWRVLFQRMDADGEPLSESLSVAGDSSNTQTYPTLANTAEGGLFGAFESSDMENTRAKFGYLPAGEDKAPDARPADDAASSGAPVLATGAEAGDPAYLAWHRDASGELKTYLRTVTATIEEGESPAALSFGASGKNDHSPAVAASPTGGAVAWYRIISGIKNNVLVQGFSNENGVLTPLGLPVFVNDSPAAPYPLSLVHIAGDLFFVAWSEGTSPDFRLRGRFFRTRMEDEREDR